MKAHKEIDRETQGKVHKNGQREVQKKAQGEAHDKVQGEAHNRAQGEVHKETPNKAPNKALRQMYNVAQEKPVIRCSISTGERVAGFMDRISGHFREVMLLRDNKDLDRFIEHYDVAIAEVKTRW